MSDPLAGVERLFALTICAYRKSGMDEDTYHQYLSEKHAPLLKNLLVHNKIVDYTMELCNDSAKQHNTSETKQMIGQMFPGLPESNVADYDCFIHIVFSDVQDYINVKNDPHYKQAVVPDHANFADGKKTTMVTGWFERHVTGGQATVAKSGTEINGLSH
ncbi:MAG: hypothetical protein Q9190_000966 [Brigantiaea leucoxantha]